jgi:hypothetical protein
VSWKDLLIFSVLEPDFVIDEEFTSQQEDDDDAGDHIGYVV